ncbi:MAG TPA: hypothetical protein VHC43_01165 [Mycobacteriales bacterium]|nr:hypothetical protein [Mycobacteriales bacterium]
MTSRSTAILAGTAVTVAVLALAARPLLPHSNTTRPPGPVPTVTPPVPSSAMAAASSAATRALACPTAPARRHTTGCGSLHLLRQQASCPTDSSCHVELVGMLRTRTVTVPVALTVTLRHTNGRWRPVEVAS